MDTPNSVVTPNQDAVSPGRTVTLKLRGGETGDSIMMFDETVPTGTMSTLHLHHHSDEVAYVLNGEVTFKIGDEVTVRGPGACAFMPRGVPHAWKSTRSADRARPVSLHPGQGGRIDRRAAADGPQVRIDERGRIGGDVAAPRLGIARTVAALSWAERKTRYSVGDRQ